MTVYRYVGRGTASAVSISARCTILMYYSKTGSNQKNLGQKYLMADELELF